MASSTAAALPIRPKPAPDGQPGDVKKDDAKPAQATPPPLPPLPATNEQPGGLLFSLVSGAIIVVDGKPKGVPTCYAGSVRLRGAIMQVIVNVLAHGDGVATAIDAPRVHVEDAHIQCEGGFDAAELDLVEAWSHNLVRWRRRNLYFGGTNAVEVLPDGSLAAAGDARRGGDGVVVG